MVVRGGVREQRHGRVAIVLICGHLMGVIGWSGGAGVATATAAAEDPGDGSNQGPVQAAAGALADKAVECRVSHTVQGGQQ